MSCGADQEANALLLSLTGSDDFDIPDVDLSGPDFQIPDTPLPGGNVTRLSNDDLTTGQIAGTGTFDALMRGFKAHLKEEYAANRITGAEYTKAYIALVDGAMGNATQYLLGRDQAFWQALQAQQAARIAEIGVVTARVQLETAKLQLKTVRLEALTVKANYGLTKMKMATESMQYCVAKFGLDFTLPKQLQVLTEQLETQRAQTMNTRTDGSAIVGVLGKQRELYDQQITSYKRDSEMKYAKILTDSWITQKTIDEGLLPPDQFENAQIDAALTKLKANLGLT